MASVYSAPKSPLQRLWHEPPPSVALEFSAQAVAAAHWTPGAGKMDQFATEPLPEGALRPSPVRDNIQRADDVRMAVSAVLGRVSRRRGGNIALLLPDVSARVSVITFEQFPVKKEEVAPLIRWRLKKTVPFEIDEAALSWRRQGRSAQGEELAVAVAPFTVVQPYEAIVESLGYQPGFVSLSSLAALGLTDAAGQQAGTMLLRASGRILTIVMFSPGRLRIFRSTELPEGETEHTLESIVTDVYSSSVYFQDNYHETATRIFMAGFGARSQALEDAIEKDVGVRPKALLVPGVRSQDETFLGLYGMIAEQAKG